MRPRVFIDIESEIAVTLAIQAARMLEEALRRARKAEWRKGDLGCLNAARTAALLSVESRVGDLTETPDASQIGWLLSEARRAKRAKEDA